MAESDKMSEYLDDYLPDDTVARMKGDTGSGRSTREERAVLLKMKPQAQIDLHGLIVKKALKKLENFIRDCRKKGLKKILIIHGKGNHTKGEPVLGREVRLFLQKCAYTGEFQAASREMGGKGALWVILR